MTVMEKYAFKMKLAPGCEAEYRKRHDEIWPELLALLKEAGYRIIRSTWTMRQIFCSPCFGARQATRWMTFPTRRS